jgi:hypothetical protein
MGQRAYKVVRMADGSFRINEVPLPEASGGLLAEISALLTKE